MKNIALLMRGLCAAILMCGLCAALSSSAATTSRTANQDWVLRQIADAQLPVGRYPLFLLNLNPGEARVWNGVEIKATTNNFDSTPVFFAASATNQDNPNVFTRDWCRLYVLTRRADSDIRKWTRIASTAALGEYAPLVLAVIVDKDMLRRGHGDAWLRENNPELTWSYTRTGLSSAETDQDGRNCWRPAMPVKWYATLPAWADQPTNVVNAADIAEYVAPWTEEIAAAITAIGAVTPEIVTNIVNAIAPTTGNYAAVSNAAMNAAQNATNLVVAATNGIPRITESADYPGNAATADFAHNAERAELATSAFGIEDGVTDKGYRSAGDIFDQIDAATATNAQQTIAIAAIETNIVRATNPNFSNAVLQVGIGIDTNTVAAINALVEAGDELPVGGAATVGGLLIALVAAIAALKKSKADAAALRYDLGTEIAISSASSEVVEGETVTYGEATLLDRTANRVAITAAIAELRLAFPAAVSGKVRDFGLRVEVGTGSAALTAPSLVPPAGVTLENADGAIPALADGAADAKGVTLLYFSETAPGVFLVKGEQVEEVA